MRHQSEVVRSGFRGPPEVARKAMKDSGPVPSTYSPHWLTPLCGGIRDGAPPRGAPAPPCPGSAAAHSVARGPPMFPTSASVGALLSTLLPVFALLRPARLLALLDRSDLERHRSPAAEDFLPELSRGRSPSPRVGYRYTAPGGGHRDRTFTGWSTAVTGCAFWRRTRPKAVPYHGFPEVGIFLCSF